MRQIGLFKLNDVDSLQRNLSSTRHSEVRVCEVTLNHQGQEQSQEKGRLNVLSGLTIGKRPAMLVVAQLSPPLQGLRKALGKTVQAAKAATISLLARSATPKPLGSQSHRVESSSRQNLPSVPLRMGWGGGVFGLGWYGGLLVHDAHNPAMNP